MDRKRWGQREKCEREGGRSGIPPVAQVPDGIEAALFQDRDGGTGDVEPIRDMDEEHLSANGLGEGGQFLDGRVAASRAGLVDDDVAGGQKLDVVRVENGVRGVPECETGEGDAKSEAGKKVAGAADVDGDGTTGGGFSLGESLNVEVIVELLRGSVVAVGVRENPHSRFQSMLPHFISHLGDGEQGGTAILEEAFVEGEFFEAVGMVAVEVGEDKAVDGFQGEIDSCPGRGLVQHLAEGGGTIDEKGLPSGKHHEAGTIVIPGEKVADAKGEELKIVVWGQGTAFPEECVSYVSPYPGVCDVSRRVRKCVWGNSATEQKLSELAPAGSLTSAGCRFIQEHGFKGGGGRRKGRYGDDYR